MHHFYLLNYSIKGGMQNIPQNDKTHNKEGYVVKYLLFLGDFEKIQVPINKNIVNIFDNEYNQNTILTNASFNGVHKNTNIELFLSNHNYNPICYHKINLKNLCPIWNKNEKYNLV